MGKAQPRKALILMTKQIRLNGRPCSNPQVIPSQSVNPKDFPDEFMEIMQGVLDPRQDTVVIVPCRVKGDNQIEMSQAVFCAGIRSFVITHDDEPPIYETSAPDRWHLKIPDTVVALVGQQIPNTENIAVALSPEEVRQGAKVGTARWTTKQRMRTTN